MMKFTSWRRHKEISVIFMIGRRWESQAEERVRPMDYCFYACQMKKSINHILSHPSFLYDEANEENGC